MLEARGLVNRAGLARALAEQVRLQPASGAALAPKFDKDDKSEEFSELLRSAIKQDEWLLFLHGAVLGFGAGLLHLAIFGV